MYLIYGASTPFINLQSDGNNLNPTDGLSPQCAQQKQPLNKYNAAEVTLEYFHIP